MRMNMLESQADNILIDKDKCTYCGICVERCVLDNLRMKLAPCRQACPLGVNCHGYVQTISRKEEDKAIALLRETLPFPGILGRICSQPCEEKCHRKNIEGEAVAIRSLKRYLSDLEDKTKISLPEMKSETGKKVAVIGSGPAGMMGAYDLCLEGHAVTVFEAESEPGGMLRWAIPEFRLPKEILEMEIDLLVRIGVKFCCGVVIGRDKSLSDIKAEFDAVLIATGCPEHAKLSLEGDDTPGIYYGLPFLMSVRRCQAPRIGKTVVVIGGGNVAVDAAQTSLRLGAKSVTIFALESESELPAFPWAVKAPSGPFGRRQTSSRSWWTVPSSIR